MKLWVSVLRRAGLAVILLGVVIMGAAIGSIATADGAAAQQIVVQGNRRVEASTIQSYFRLTPGERLDDFKIDTAYKALISTGLFKDVQIRRAGAQIGLRYTPGGGNIDFDLIAGRYIDGVTPTSLTAGVIVRF